MSEFTDYFLARSTSVAALCDQLAHAQIPCVVIDDQTGTSPAAQSGGSTRWWAVLASDVHDLPAPAGRAARQEVIDSLEPLIPVPVPPVYRRHIAIELRNVASPLLQFTAGEGALEWSVLLWVRGVVAPVMLVAAWEPARAIDGINDDHTLEQFASVLQCNNHDLRAHLVPGLGSAEAFAAFAHLPWLPMTERSAVPPTSWLAEHGMAVRTSLIGG
jgi:hypothetical protein